jgi:GH35 family endo-1,4-beta-xylanase
MRSSLFSLLFVTLVATALAAPRVATAEAPPGVAEIEARLLAEAREGAERHRKGDAVLAFVRPDGRPVDGATVTLRQETHEFLLGALLFGLVGHGEPEAHRPDAFKARFLRLFNLGVLPFYWSGHEPVPGRPLWPRMTGTIEWALAHGVTLKGHPLAWTHTAGTPQWLRTLPVETTETLLQARVTATVAGLAGTIDLWDVVNEPVNTVTWRMAHAEAAPGDDPRYRFVGIPEVADWIEPLYRAAHAANPRATLVLNEFHQVMKPEVRRRFLDLARTLQRRRVPLHALGLQVHEPLDAWFPPAELRLTLDECAALSLPLHLTEFIPQSSGKPITGGWREGTWTEEAQAEYAEQVYRIAFGHPAVELVNWWAFSDRDAWMPGGGLVDADYRPKPVFRRLERLVNEEWRTSFESRTDSAGAVAFRGFYGRYAVTLRESDGTAHAFTVVLSKKAGTDGRFRLTVRP